MISASECDTASDMGHVPHQQDRKKESEISKLGLVRNTSRNSAGVLWAVEMVRSRR